MMKKNSKVIHVELRKESKKFKGWLMYEITIKNTDGTIENIPAYGKDLQDALSRVVHDKKLERILPRVNKIPIIVWVISWFSILLYVTLQVIKYHLELGDWLGLIYLSTLSLLTFGTIAIGNWLKLKNTYKK